MNIIIGETIFERLLKEAATNARLRTNHDLRNSESDTSQRMLNALSPGTKVPVHRHLHSSETVVLLKGRIDEVYYDSAGNETGRVALPLLPNSRSVFLSRNGLRTSTSAMRLGLTTAVPDTLNFSRLRMKET